MFSNCNSRTIAIRTTLAILSDIIDVFENSGHVRNSRLTAGNPDTKVSQLTQAQFESGLQLYKYLSTSSEYHPSSQVLMEISTSLENKLQESK